MKESSISNKQAISIIFFFIIGESSILLPGLSAKKDLWLSILLSFFMILPFIFVYSRLFTIFPGKDLFDVIKICFGNFIGKGIILLYTWYALDLSALVLRDFGQFVNTINLIKTPIMVSLICIMFLCIWIIKEGIEVMGKFSEIFFILPMILLIIVILFLIPNMNLNNIRPLLYNGIKPVMKGAYEVFIYPFGEIVIFTTIFSSFKEKKSIYSIYLYSLLLGGIFLFLTSLTIILTLGINNALSLYFPGYATVGHVHIGDILQRIEAISALVFLLGGFIKVSIYLFAACKGVAKIFDCSNYKFIVTPIALLILNLTYFEFENIMSFNEWIFDVWIYYAFLFIVILPITILIFAEIKKRFSTANQKS
ncbi:GerAB/ArcD/ProY family transporter [Crassaminicella profunda]|uniref:GerAB/ArcD/ProY family transporter n=1 Tax=Crassaminicella profunda TaxID=1286698 RepID=UPI001CA68B78|nr:endospore germination permease [Crassaminicella profunda]QZY55112.1 endospore germination permease [Crassaminicella profunda]